MKLNPPNAHRSKLAKKCKRELCSFGSCKTRFEFLSQFRKVRNAFECFVTQVQTRLPKSKRVWPMKINVICTVYWLKFDTRTGTLHLDGFTRVLPTARPVFSANNVRPSYKPLEGIGRPPAVRTVQWITASEYGGIEQWPERVVSIRCSCSEAPPSVNSRPEYVVTPNLKHQFL